MTTGISRRSQGVCRYENFELEYIKMDSQRAMVRCQSENCIIDKGAKGLIIRIFCNEHTCNISGGEKTLGKLNLDGHLLSWKNKFPLILAPIPQRSGMTFRDINVSHYKSWKRNELASEEIHKSWEDPYILPSLHGLSFGGWSRRVSTLGPWSRWSFWGVYGLLNLVVVTRVI